MSRRQKTKKYLCLLVLSLLIILIADYLSLTPSATGQAQETEVTLTWSTDSYIPLDYPGKALPTRESLIEVAATVDWPAGREEINPSELVYNWFLNDHIQKSDSGEGKQVFKFGSQGTIKQRHLVKVEIKNKEGGLLGFSPYLSIELTEPQIVLQPTKSNGVKTKISATPQLISQQYQISANQEIEFMAQPYFFDIEEVNELNYSWSLAGQVASKISPDKPNLFILKVGQLAQIISQELRVWAENKNNPFQRAQTNVEIILRP